MTDLDVSYSTASPSIEFGVDRLVGTLRADGATVGRHDRTEEVEADVCVSVDETTAAVEAEGFSIRREDETVRVLASDETEQERAVEHLREARDHWDGLIGVTQRHYREIPYATDWREGNTFSWAQYRDQVERDVRIAEGAEPRS